MIDRIRRHGRLIAGSLALVLCAGIAYVLHSAGSAHAQPTRAAPQVHAIAPVLATAAQRRTMTARAAAAARKAGSAGATARVRSSAVPSRRGRTGLPTYAPSTRTLSGALQKLTGLTAAQVSTRAVCPRARPGYATCAARALVVRSTGALVRPHIARYSALGRVSRAAVRGAQPAAVPAASPPDPGTPAYLQQAYDLSYLSQTAGANDTVAIVDAHDDPSAEEDLGTYRANYGLPACTSENGCFEKVGQDGTPALPAADPGWEQEISLDLDSVSAVCPLCHILLVETNSSKFSDLEAGMQTAATLGANQISASWFGTSGSVPAFRTFSGVATVAATGDYGYPGAGQDNYPAALPGVTAAGGTSLAPAATSGARGFGESAWSWNGLNGGGSGCDLQFARPVYQPAAGCLGRAYADVSADADPQTGLAVYDHGSWSVVGGTSLATPLIAAYYAVTGVGGANPQWAYGKSGSLNDIVSGSTGNCAASISYICNAAVGYDGPTGVGSISGSVITGAPGVDGPAIGSGSNSGNTYTQSVAAHGATIAGGIYRNGLDTKWWIEYGTSTSYGSQTPAQDIGAGSSPVAVTGYLSQLAAGTTYHYRLVAQNSLGTTDGYDYTFTTPAAVSGAPTAAFTVSTVSPTPGAPVTFNAFASTAPSGSSISDYSWKFGDGTTLDKGGTSSASHTYAARGTYTVTLTVKTNHGQTDSSSQTVTVDNAPTAAFTPSDTAVPAGTSVAFDGGASRAGAGGSLTDYSWSFGDGSTADGGTGATESHSFTTPGTYTVSLTTTDDLDVTSTTTQTITVAPFTLSQAIPAPSTPVTFTALAPDPSCGTVTGYTWNFGDGSGPQSTTSTSIPYTYSARGSYTVSLSYECSGTPVPDSTATVNVDTPPTAAFTPSASVFVPGTTVSFDAGASSASTGGTISDYAWNFGDGSPVLHTTTPAASHTFSTVGTYTVTLTITDDLGATSALASAQVTADEPTAAFTVSSPNPAPDSPVSFDGSASSDPASAIIDYAWNFGDGTAVDAGATPQTTHSFSAAGTYTVKLTVTDQLGQTNTVTRQVVIAPTVSQSSNPPTTSTTTPTPVPPTTTTPVTSHPPTTTAPVTKTQAPLALLAQLTGTHRQRLAQVLAHGLRVALTLNQRTRASFQITLPLAQTKQGSTAKHHPQGNAVLLRGVQILAAGKHAVALKLSRTAARRLAGKGPLVLTVRVTLAGTGGGKTLTRTLKVALTR